MKKHDKYPQMSFEFVTIEYIENKLNEHGMNKMDLARQLGQKHQNVYRLFEGKRELTKWHQAAIYYYFKSLEK